MAEGLQGTLVAPDRCVHHVDGEQDLLQLQDTYGFGKDVLGNLKQMLRKTPMAAGRDRRRKAGGADAPWQLLEDAAFLREEHTRMFVGLVGSNAHRLEAFREQTAVEVTPDMFYKVLRGERAIPGWAVQTKTPAALFELPSGSSISYVEVAAGSQLYNEQELNAATPPLRTDDSRRDLAPSHELLGG